jgi:hypothetical protein
MGDETLGGEEQGAADEPQHGHTAWHETRAIHQVTQQHPVPDASKDAGTKQERPVMERDQRLAGGDEQGSICVGSAGEVLPQGHDR